MNVRQMQRNSTVLEMDQAKGPCKDEGLSKFIELTPKGGIVFMQRLQALWIPACLVLTALLSVIAFAAEPGDNLLRNAEFELGTDPAGGPLHWTPFSGVPGVDYELSTERVASGAKSLKIIDRGATQSVGLRSAWVEVSGGQRFRAMVDVYIEEGTAMLYVDFLDAQGARVSALTANTSVAGSWQTLTVEATAPQRAAYVTLILYSSIPNVGTLYFDNARLYDISNQLVVLEEREPSNREIGFRPHDGQRVNVTPPPLVWLPTARAVSYTVELAQDPTFPTAATQRIEGIELPLYTHSQTLAPGEWYWRYWVMTDQGSLAGPSQVRSFIVEEGLPELPLPPTEVWLARIPTSHPRMFLRPEDVQALRERINVRAMSAVFTKGQLAARIGADLPPEPESPYATGALDIEVWQQGLDAMIPAFDTLEELAFLYLMHGGEEYAREGKRLLVHLAGMNPSGVTSYRGAPEVAMRMLWSLPRAYSWLYDALTEEERDIVRRTMRVRGQEAYNMLKALPFETSPYSSHPGRILGFLGQLSVAFMGEIPEAEGWLDYVVKILFAVYPAWGGDDGGYSEGNNYWRAYMNWMFDFLDVLKAATGLDLYPKPFFRNTGYFALYTSAPGMAQPFSDAQNGPTGGWDQIVMTHLARIHQDPYFSWYVNRIGGMTPRSKVLALVFGNVPMPPAKEPTDLPDARWFRDVGWVALHRDLANPSENVQFTFKSSPLGSASHSHSDQNAFVIYAYGDGLAISSGYYPWSRSPHHEQWTNATRSKNSLLIDGAGQPIFDIDAAGEILGLFHSGVYDYTAGEASGAYVNPNLQRFTRHVVYIRPDMYLLIDDVRTQKPVSVEWLLHSRFPIVWNQGEQRAYITGQRGQLDVHMLTPTGLTADVNDEFPVPPEVATYAKEWHMTVALPQKVTDVVIASLLVTGRASGGAPEILDAEARVEGETVDVTIRHRSDGVVVTEHVRMLLPPLGTNTVARVDAVAYGEDGAVLRAFASGGTVTTEGIASITEGWSAGVRWDSVQRRAIVQVGRTEALAQGERLEPGLGVTLELEAPFEPTALVLNGHAVTSWSYDPLRRMVRVEF